MKIVLLSLLILSASVQAVAEDGACVGKTKSGKMISVYYFTNGYTDDNIDYYGKISISRSSPTTYALYATASGMQGEATKFSKNQGLDLGAVKLQISPDRKVMNGVVGQEEFAGLSCR